MSQVKSELAHKSPSSTRQIEGELFCLEALFPEDSIYEYNEDPLLAYKATVDPDTMYLHQARKQNDWEEFREAMRKEIDDRVKGDNFEIIERHKVPTGTEVLPAVWQLRRKRDIKTQEVKKYKARLNIEFITMNHTHQLPPGIV
jgi:hypothetical protein